MVLIEENQTELLMQGESLGRWSLVDVRADRLIANAFSLALGGDEVTFIADEPVDFAYRGVEQMANVWAKYRAMTLPRRVVANRRSRAGSKPSRISELRSAMIENLEHGLAPAERVEKPTVHQPASISPFHAPPPRETPEPEKAPPADTPEPVPSAEVDTPAPLGRALSPEPEPEPEPLPEPREAEPAARHIAEPAPVDAPSPEPAAPEPPVESVFKESVPWLTPETRVQSQPQQAAEPVEEPVDEPTTADEVFASDRPPLGHPEPDRLHPTRSDDAPETLGRPGASQPSPAQPEPSETVPSKPETLEPAAATTPVAPETPSPKRFVVDLGAFEDEKEQEERARQDQEPVEPALAGAVERGGIMGAVRAAFVRNRPEHDHDYVSAPGGIGIVRQICTECGHISIGTSD